MQNQIMTTLKELRKKGACLDGYNKLVRSLQGKEFTDTDIERGTYIRYKHTEEIPLSYILTSNGLDDALWALRASNATPKDCRLLAVAFAKEVRHLMTDARSLKALEVAELHAYNKATDEELAAAWEAAGVVSDAAWVAVRDAASEYVYVESEEAWVVSEDTRAARLEAWAVSEAARAAREVVRESAKAAVWAAGDAAREASCAVKEKQFEIFKQYLEGKLSWQV